MRSTIAVLPLTVFIVRCMVYEVAMIQNAPKNMLLELQHYFDLTHTVQNLESLGLLCQTFIKLISWLF